MDFLNITLFVSTAVCFALWRRGVEDYRELFQELNRIVDNATHDLTRSTKTQEEHCKQILSLNAELDRSKDFAYKVVDENQKLEENVRKLTSEIKVWECRYNDLDELSDKAYDKLDVLRAKLSELTTEIFEH